MDIFDPVLLTAIWGGIVSACSLYVSSTKTKDHWLYTTVEFLALNFGKAKDKFSDK